MTQPPAAIDQMIWQLAETDDVAAHADFVAKYPEFKDELQHRSALVKRLRTLRAPAARLPKFVPSPAAPVGGGQKWMVPVAAVLVLSSMVFAVVAGVRFAQSQQPSPVSVPPSAPASAQVVQPSPTPAGGAPAALEGQTQVAPPTATTQLRQPVQADPVEAKPHASRWDTPVTIQAKRANLATVVLGIAASAHVAVELAPGMPDPTIEVDYHKQPAGEVLRDLGRVFGFSVLFESDRKAVLIPTPDRDQQRKPPLGKATPSNPPASGQVEFGAAPKGTLPGVGG